MKDYHVVPDDDLIDHSTAEDSCVCGPKVEIVPTPKGDTHIYIHASLDGRELVERTGEKTPKGWIVYD